ncbi:phosphotransferase family protein [Actinomycetospora sp. CA-053990]|uniref:phosphotransferase family protein n=1 Tax=Actinomycetospora sp. CA-053990 TaxID=3239891 RepID=UPI003D8B3147
MTADPAPADARAITAFLRRRRLVAPDVEVQVEALPGGVSNDVLAVSAPGVDAVVKRALGQLRVEQLWLADPGRIDTEGRALQLAGRLTPGAVPRVHDLHDGYLVIERAPRSWHTWKEELLAGRVRVEIAERLGRLLGTWQRATAHDAWTRLQFGDRTAFTQLRVDPFHRTIARRHPELREEIETTIEVMDSADVCLVHGDYTPKNVMVGPGEEDPGRLWVIDWEVAHVGDPTFDPAWTVGHLLLKTMHRPAVGPEYAIAARRFLTALQAALDGAVVLDAAQLVRQTACLLLARVDGTSPAGYLDDHAAARTRELGRRLLVDAPDTVTDAWEDLP